MSLEAAIYRQMMDDVDSNTNPRNRNPSVYSLSSAGSPGLEGEHEIAAAASRAWVKIEKESALITGALLGFLGTASARLCSGL